MIATDQSANAEKVKVRVPVEDPAALDSFLAELLPESTAEARAVIVGLVSRQNKEITRLAAALSALRRGRSGGDSRPPDMDKTRSRSTADFRAVAPAATICIS